MTIWSRFASFFAFQLTSLSKKVPALSVLVFSCFLILFSFFWFHIWFSRIVRAKANGGADYGKGRDHPRLLFLRNKIRVVGAWGQAIPFIWESVQNSRERNDDNRHSRSLFLAHRYLFLSFFLALFSLFPFSFSCISFDSHAMYCVYKSLLARVCIQWCPMYMWV